MPSERIVVESTLNTTRGRQRVKTYCGLVFDRIEDGVPIYHFAKPGKWREENKSHAYEDTDV